MPPPFDIIFDLTLIQLAELFAGKASPSPFDLGIRLCYDLALILIAGLLVGKAARFFRVPMVTGYILAGILIGPSLPAVLGLPTHAWPPGLQWLGHYQGLISHGEGLQLKAISRVALVAIMFMIGTEFESSHFRRVGRRILILAGFDAGVTFVLVGALTLLAAVFALSFSGWAAARVGLLLGALAIATAPAATLMVIKEYDSEGPVTENILALVALNNLICVVLFYAMLMLPGTTADLSFGGAALEFLRSVFGSLLAGVLIGLAVSYLDRKISGKEQVVVTIGGILLVTGVSSILHLSSMLTALAFGVIFVNAASDPRKVTDEVYKTALPLYVAFFVLAGAHLDLSKLGDVGVIGLCYVVARTAAKLLGIAWGCRVTGAVQTVRQYMGLGMLCQAGVVIGLIGLLGDDAVGKTIQTTILAAVLVFEISGPILVKFSVVKSGEVKLVNLMRGRQYESGQSDIVSVLTNLLHAMGFDRFRGRDVSELRVKQLMRESVKSIRDSANLAEVIAAVEHSKYQHFPVIDEQGALKGMISFDDIRDILFDKEMAKLVIAADLAHAEAPRLSPDDSIEEALNIFDACDFGSLPVVDPENPDKLIGLLEQRSVLKVFHETRHEEG